MPDRSSAAPPATEEPGADDAAPQPADTAMPSVGSWVTPERPAWQRFAIDNARILIALGLLAAGVTFVLMGWYGAAYTNIITTQIPFLISGGLLGLGLIIVAGFMASSAMLERRIDEMRREIVRALGSMPEPGTNGAGPSGGAHASVFVLRGGHSYHLAGCPILEGKDGLEQLRPREAIASGFAACKLCGPE